MHVYLRFSGKRLRQRWWDVLDVKVNHEDELRRVCTSSSGECLREQLGERSPGSCILASQSIRGGVEGEPFFFFLFFFLIEL